MDEITQDLDCYVYLDDILIASTSLKEHEDHIRQLCKLLKAFGMAVGEDKCLLGVDSLKFLGHIVDKNGIIQTPKKVQGITDFKAPTDQKETYLVMLNYNQQSLPKLAAVLQLL